MKLTLSTYFHIGFAFGTNDTAFQSGMSNLILKDYEKKIERKNKSLRNRLGNGLTLDYTESPFLEDLKRGAYNLIDDEKFLDDFAIDKDIRSQILSIIPNLSFNCELGIYSCGITTVEVTLCDNNDEDYCIAMFRLGQMFEYAAYGDYKSGTTFHKELLERVVEISNTFVTDQSLKEITTKEADADNFAYNFFPSVTFLFYTENINVLDKLRDYRISYGDTYNTLSVDHCTIYASWYIMLIGHDGTDKTIADVVRLYNLFFGACERTEEIMNDVIYYLINTSDKDDKLDKLIKLQLTGNLIINNTNTHILTQNMELLDIFSVLNNYGNLEIFHSSVKRSLDVCMDIKSQLTHDREKKEDELDKKRDSRISFFGIIFTTLTFVSVVADLFNLDQLTGELIGSSLMRWSIYITTYILLVFFVTCLFFGKHSVYTSIKAFVYNRMNLWQYPSNHKKKE